MAKRYNRCTKNPSTCWPKGVIVQTGSLAATKSERFQGRLSENLLPKSFFIIIDRAPFETCGGKKGRILLLSAPEALAVRRRQRRHRPPKQPAIQGALQRGVALRYELESTPGLTRSALARKLKLDPSRVTQILNLFNLAPEIQDYIRNLPPSKHHSQISDDAWMRLARIRDYRLQRQEFDRLLETTRPDEQSKQTTNARAAFA